MINYNYYQYYSINLSSIFPLPPSKDTPHDLNVICNL